MKEECTFIIRKENEREDIRVPKNKERQDAEYSSARYASPCSRYVQSVTSESVSAVCALFLGIQSLTFGWCDMYRVVLLF